jgi:hypothetical protein
VSESEGQDQPHPTIGEEPDISAGLQAELDRCKPPLRNFGLAPEGHPGFAYSKLESAQVAVDRGRLPVVAAVHLIMRLLIGTHDLGRAEKLAWEYPFTYRGRVCSLAMMKFGLRLYLQAPEGAEVRADADADEIISKLAASARLVERNLLQSLVNDEVSENRIIVHNQVGQLRGMYQYFRDLAEAAYAGDGLLAARFDEQHKDSVFLKQLRSLPEQQEGFFATIAMITAYFSVLEHLLVFALSVSDFDPARESLKDFIGLRLLEKYKRLYNVTDDQEARGFYNRLHEVAEKWRNPYDHGGFDKRGGALSIAVPSLGAIPLMLSDIRGHPTFHFLPERETSFDEVTILFDELDAWLRQSPLGPGIAWADAGLNISFEAERVVEMRQAIASGTFDDLLTRVSYLDDQMTNMDW